MPSTDRARASALVGRAQELAAIEQALDRLAGGQPAALAVVGEAGIGKVAPVS
jgi:predicted ATPase